MHVRSAAAGFLIFLLSAAPASAQASVQASTQASVQAGQVRGPAPVPVSELVSRAKELDAQDIVVQGEVLGELMRRGEYVWLNLLDDGVAIGVWAREKDLPPIGYRGGYWAKGDILRVEGKFHRACPDHGGDLDLHASSIAVVQKGTTVAVEVRKDRMAAAVVFCLAGSILAFLWRRREGETSNS
jgi:hypothetical protein